jgi:oxygen-independent coproporphyrinogen III oxidase
MTQPSLKTLNFYKFLTVKLTDDDLYPHYTYGEEFSLGQVRAFWKKTAGLMLKKKAPQKLGLYVHIPFCRQKCSFCFCDSYIPSSYSPVRQYLRLLTDEIDAFRDILRPLAFTSIYFGGGSPSYLKTEDLESLFSHIYASLRIQKDAQVIFEGTPTDLNMDNLALAAKYGVNRLTIGAQSLDPKVIKLIRRPQTKASFVRAFRLARRLGIPYINVDLIAGLEGQSVKSFLDDLKTVLELGADMVHVTGFTPLAHTPFCRAGNRLSLSQKRNREIMVGLSHEILTKFYKDISAENAGSSEKAENVQETDLRKENSSLLGIGYGSQSHAFGQAWYQHPHLIMMKSKPDFKKIPPFFGVRGSLDEEMRKFIFSNLQRGFSRKFFYALFGEDALKVFKGQIGCLVRDGKLKVDGDRVISSINKRQDFLVYSKLFYSQKRIDSIFQAHKGEYDQNRDYQKDMDTLYAETD